MARVVGGDVDRNESVELRESVDSSDEHVEDGAGESAVEHVVEGGERDESAELWDSVDSSEVHVEEGAGDRDEEELEVVLERELEEFPSTATSSGPEWRMNENDLTALFFLTTDLGILSLGDEIAFPLALAAALL